MIKFEEKNKKTISEFRNAIFFLFVLFIGCVVSTCFGYYEGKEAVRTEAVSKGYAKFTKSGFAWKTWRLIGLGKE